MLPREHRLTAGADFRLAGRRGRRAGTKTLVVHLWVPDEESGSPQAGSPQVRVGFVVSKAVGNAVVRNRVKRRLRHLVRDRVDRLPDFGVLVVRALPPAAEADHARLGGDLDKALTRVVARDAR